MTRRPTVLGEFSDPLTDEDPPFMRVAEGRFASRTYRFFLRIHDVRMIPPQIPRIAHALGAEEDCVWEMFFKYMRGADEPWRA